jgi:DNA-binding transcriptional MerR regulator
MRSRLTIGEFAAYTHLSVRTLRRYHEAGLLQPVRVDSVSGYRYYTTEQIPTAQVIHRLRQLDVPLAEVKSILATDDIQRREELIAGHLDRLEDELDRTRAAVVALRQLLRPEGHDLTVELRSVPTRTVIAISDTVRRDVVHRWYDAAMAELDAALPALEQTGPPGGRYANELFTEDLGDVMVFRPVRSPSPSGRIEVVELPPVELAVTVHPGPHDAISETYGNLGRWVVEHALALDGPIHETYLVGPRDTDIASDWRTEIGWPIFRLAADQ